MPNPERTTNPSRRVHPAPARTPPDAGWDAAAVQRTAPLSFAQQRLWFLDRLAPGTSAYNLPLGLRLHGPLEPARLAACLGEAARRHAPLRTRFVEGADGPEQEILEPRPLPLPEVDLASLPPPALEDEQRRLAENEAERPFDLAAGPLFRCLLLRLASTDWLLVLAHHHIITDGVSMGVLLRDLSALYEASWVGEASPLPPLAVQYADFAHWQRERLQGKRLERWLGYWRDQLAGQPPALELPTDRPRPAVQGTRGATETLRLDAATAAGLRRLARASGASLFMAGLAGYAALLGRWAGADDLVVGTPWAGRTRVELEGLVGLFVNTLPLRLRLAGEPAYSQLVEQVREVAVGAYANGDLPFERLVEELAPDRDLSRSPLLQTLFALQAEPFAPSFRLGPVVAESLPLPIGAAKLDLALTLAEAGGEIEGVLTYAADLFDAATMRRLARQLERLFAGAAADPGQPIAGLPLLAPEERHALLWERNDRAHPAPSWEPVHERFRRQARLRPQAVAVIEGDRRLSYGELEEKSNRLAHVLRSLGVGPDVPVALASETTIERVLAVVAILKAGGAFASFDPAYPTARLESMLDDVAAPVLLAQAGLAGRLRSGRTQVLFLDRDLPGLEGDGSPPPEIEVDPDHLAYLVFTSGSTGRPKAVATPHRGLANLVDWFAGRYRLTAGDRGSLLASPAFDVSIAELWPFLTVGAGVAIPDEATRLSASRTLRWWAEESITLPFLPTPLGEAVLEEELPAALDLRVRELLVAGDRLRRPPSPGTPFALSNYYGPAEYSVASTEGVVPAEGEGVGAGRPPSIGAPIGNTRVVVLDRRFEPVPLGVVGELYVAGAGLARGYLNRPELTAERFLPDPWGALRGEPGARMYRTGDRVRWLPGGELDFLGRTDHQVKLRGMRVELGEIEAVLARQPGVRAATVLAVPDRTGGLHLVAYVAAAGQAAELRPALAAQLPEYMLPAAFVQLEALPLTPNGKVDRRALAALDVAPPAEDDYVAPRTDFEAEVAGIWAEVLGLERVGIHQTFWSLGGHSLLATRVLGRVRGALGVDLPLPALFKAPTVAELALLIGEALLEEDPIEQDAERCLGAENAVRDAPLSCAQQRLWFLDRLLPGTAAYNVPQALRLCGRLEPARLAAALGEVVRRHGTLRTRFVDGEAGPRQEILPAQPMLLPVVDLWALPDSARSVEQAGQVAAAAARPFDLAVGPPLRAFLLRSAEEEWVLVLVLHHIVTDGWSTGLLFDELSTLYSASAAGRPPQLPALPAQYADFALWQGEQRRGDRADETLRYWRRQMEGHPPLLRLPTDRPRPAVQDVRGGYETLLLEAATTAGLRRLSLRSGASLFMVALAGFLILLQRHSGSDDLVVGTPWAARTRVELERLIGLFVNTLPLRVRLDGDPSVAELIERIRSVALEAYAHADLPFEQLVEELAPERSLSHAPLFQVSFSLQNQERARSELGGLPLERLPVAPAAAKFDLSLGMAEGPAAIAAALEYRRDLFDAATMRRMAGHLATLFAALGQDSAARISTLPLLSPPERSALLVEWSGAGVAAGSPGGAPPLVHEAFTAVAVRQPEALAVETPAGERLTYGELAARSAALAFALRSLGVGPESVVAVYAERSPELVVGLLGTLRAGAAYLPLDPAYPMERIAIMLGGAEVVLTQERLAERLPPTGARLVLLDRFGKEGDGVPLPVVDPVAIQGSNPAYLLYTSGSTGRPKGVLIAHYALASYLAHSRRSFGVGPADRVLQFAALGFDTSVEEVFATLTSGAALVLRDEAMIGTVRGFLDEVGRLGITLLDLPAAYWHEVVAEMEGQGLDLPPSVRLVILGGEEVLAERLDLWRRRVGPGVRLVNSYGPAEATIAATQTELALSPASPSSGVSLALARVGIGRPVAGARVYVLGAQGDLLPQGAEGELCVAGSGLARGYFGSPGLTAERFVPDPWGALHGEPGARRYLTGDRARWLPDGSLAFLGRLDQQVKIRGMRLEPGEVEAALLSHPGVAEAVVAAVDGGAAGKQLAAFLVGAGRTLASHTPSDTELRDHLRARLPEFMVPSAYVWLEGLPSTPNGKVDRLALAAIPVTMAPAAPFVAPRTPLERLVAEIWSFVLGREPVGIHDSFWELGGHSLLAARLLARLRADFGVDLQLRALFEAPTIAELTVAIADGLGEGIGDSDSDSATEETEVSARLA